MDSYGLQVLGRHPWPWRFICREVEDGMPGALRIRSRVVGAIRRLQCLSSLYGGIHGEGDEGKREKERGFGMLSLITRLTEVALQLKNWKLLSFKHPVRSSW